MNTSKYIEFVMKDSINKYAFKNSKVTHISNRNPNPGKVAVTYSKDDLSNYGVKGIIFGSIEKLVDSSGSITHWTPNPYTYLKYDENKRITKHTKDNIKQINTFVIDIDKDYSESYLKQSLISAHLDNHVPFPNMYIKSPNGWHLYYVLDNPMYMNKEQRSLYVAEKVQKNILKALSAYIEVDVNCVPFGFYRFPTEENVKHFTDEYISKDDLIHWSMKYSESHNEPLKVVYAKLQSKQPDWVTTLLNLKNIQPKNGYRACRNNTLFTLALYFYSVGKDEEKTFDILDEFNSSLNTPLNINEFKGIVQSAFSGKYQAPNKEHIQIIIETWTNENYDINDKYFKTFYKHKKERAERTRSHYEERVQDVINYLENNTDMKSLYIEGNMKDILARFNIPKSTFYDILNKLQNDNIIYKQTGGKGRYSKTRIALFKNILKKVYEVIMKNKFKREEYNNYLESILNDILNTEKQENVTEQAQIIGGKIEYIFKQKHKPKERIIENNVLII